MTKIAYIGPQYSFSYDLAFSKFRNADHHAYRTLGQVVTSVARGECDCGLVPFYNTNFQSIRETQLEIIKHRNKIFVTDILSMKVRHFLCGQGKLANVREIHSKSVVFEQASKWLQRRMPNARRKFTDSTSAAVKWVSGTKRKDVAAIGSKSACDAYGAPILKGDIQNNPNVTVFFVIERKRPDPLKSDRVLMCVTNTSQSQMHQIEDLVKETGCSISTGWQLRLDESGRKTAYFCELDGEYCNLDLNSAVMRLKDHVEGSFLVGGYQKCITSLMA